MGLPRYDCYMRGNLPVPSHRGVGEADSAFGRAGAAALPPADWIHRRLHSVAKESRDVDVAQVLGAELGPLERPPDHLLLGLALGLAAEAGGNDGDLDLALHGVVAHDTEDDVGARVGGRANDLGGLL